MTKIRAKLEIIIKDEVRHGFINYDLKIKVPKKDDRFEISKRAVHFSSIICTAPNGFTLSTNTQDTKGSIYTNRFVFPHDMQNISVKHTFLTDDARKEYLKKLHSALFHWSGNWGIFKLENSKIKFKTRGNKWYFYALGN